MNQSLNQATPAVLALADGTIFRGLSIGAKGAHVAETVFNTSMYGYQEIITDPSYAGQFITFTYPHIGNVGCNEADFESNKSYCSGIIFRDLSRVTSNFRSMLTLPQFLEQQNIVGIYGIDTRKLVIHLRDFGSQMGAIASGENLNIEELVSTARAAGGMEGKDYVKSVTTPSEYGWDQGTWIPKLQKYSTYSQETLLQRPHLVAIDCGIKRNILRLMLDAGFRVTVVPAGTDAERIKSLKPDGLFISNGPGDPATVNYVVAPVKDLLGKLPILGICLGHQILGIALGGKTYKLKFGHRGGNHPVRDNRTGKIEITVQNHGFAVDEKSLPKNIKVTHTNLNDGTVEGILEPNLKVFSVQYHPESSPGPHDSRYLFDQFYQLVVNPSQFQY